MSEVFLKTVQKFLNNHFTYEGLTVFLDKQSDYLLKPEVMERIESDEYNALWDTLNDIKDRFSFANKPGFLIATEISVQQIFTGNLKWRQNAT